MPSATLLVAERNDLVGAARIALSAFPNVELVTADANQLLQQATGASAILLPSSGNPDGNGLCRSLKQQNPTARVLVVVDDPAGREAAMEAGADDIIVGQLEPDDLRVRLGRLGGVSFTKNERVEIPLAVSLTMGESTYPAQALAISREAIFISWPNPPAVGTSMRITLSPYEGTTIQLWGRVQNTIGPGGADGLSSEGALVRFLGVTKDELHAISYLVDYYSESSGTSEANGSTAAPVENEPIAEDDAPSIEATGKSSDHADAPKKSGPSPSSPWDQLTETSAGRAVMVESVSALADADAEQLAIAATTFSKTRDTSQLPAGISSDEMRGFLPRLTPPETSAMRGTSTLADLTGDLLRSAGSRLKCLILTARFRTLTKKLYDPNVQLAAEEATTRILDEVVQIHGVLNQQMQVRMQGGNMEAARDLRQVTTSLLQTAQELENALDKYIFGAEVEETSAPVLKAPPEIARYDKPKPTESPTSPTPKGKTETTGSKSKSKSKTKPKPKASKKDGPPSNTGRRIALAVLLIVAVGGTLWTYKNMFVGGGESGFVTTHALVTIHEVNIWRITTSPDGTEVRVMTDATYDKLPVEERPAFFEEVQEYVDSQYGEGKIIFVRNHIGTLAGRTLKGEWQIEPL